jgi:hypothetical protein
VFKNASRRRAYPGGIGLRSQPAACAGMVEVPNHGVLAAYTTKERMRAHVRSAVSAVQVPELTRTETHYVSLGSHHHNPAGWPALLKALKSIQKTQGDSIEFAVTKHVRPFRPGLRGGGGGPRFGVGRLRRFGRLTVKRRMSLSHSRQALLLLAFAFGRR